MRRLMLGAGALALICYSPNDETGGGAPAEPAGDDPGTGQTEGGQESEVEPPAEDAPQPAPEPAQEDQSQDDDAGDDTQTGVEAAPADDTEQTDGIEGEDLPAQEAAADEAGE